MNKRTSEPSYLVSDGQSLWRRHVGRHLNDRKRSYGRLLRRSLFVVLLFNCSVTSPSLAEQATLDSLTNRLQENLHDTDRVKTLNDLAWELMYTNPDTAIILSSEALSISEAYEWQSGIVNSVGQLGSFNRLKGDYPQALEYYFKSLKMNEELDRKTGIAIRLGNIGVAYMEQGNYRKALEYYFKALKIDIELGNKNGIAINLGNIGNVYKEQGDSAVAASRIGWDLAIADKYPKALALPAEAHYAKALEYYFKALKIDEELDKKSGIAANLGNVGALYTAMGEFEKAEITLQKALTLSKEIGAKEYLKDQYNYLSNLYDTIAKSAKAFEAYKLYIIYRDSIANEENIKAQTRTEMKYEYEKAELLKEQEEKEGSRLLQEARSRRDNLQYSVVLICLLVIGVVVAMLGRLSLPIKMAEGIIFFSFLILFEFILVLADPYIDQWSGGAPGFKLLFNAGIAAMIFPLHAFFESIMKGRLVKNAG